MTIELNPITSGYSTGLINDNFQAIEDYVNDKLLQRDGVEIGEINQMEVDLDMNSHFVYNLPEPVLEHQAARLQDVQNAVAGGAANLITFTPYGSITSENVQGAIQELADSTAQDPNTFEVDTETGTQTLQDALNDRATKTDIDGFASTQETLLTVNIPTDYSTIQAAIDDLSTLSVKQGAIIDIVIETGHNPTAGVRVENGDYGHFRISSVDATVTLPAGFPATDVIKGVNARMPVLNCKINAGGFGLSGYVADQASFGAVTSGSGVINAARHGLLADNASTVYANDTSWNGASQSSNDWSGILSWGSRIMAEGADVRSSAWYGAQAAAGGILSFRGGLASTAGRYGVRATNMGFIDAREAIVNGCAIYGIYAYIGSTINCMGATASNNGTANIIALRSSTIDASIEGGVSTTCDGGGSTASVQASFNSRIHAGGISISNSNNHGILAESGSVVTAPTCTINSVGSQGVRATSSSTINVVNSTISNAATGARAVTSNISVRSVGFSSITNEAVFIEAGANVQADGATVGGAAFSTSHTNADTLNGFNSVGPGKGIVWA